MRLMSSTFTNVFVFRASVVIREAEILDVYKILKTYTLKEIAEMKNQVCEM